MSNRLASRPVDRLGALPGRSAIGFLALYLTVFLAVAAWSIATPLYASPDEPVQVIRAVSVAHGQFIGTAKSGSSDPRTVVKVPLLFVAGLHVPGCFVRRPDAIPTCSAPLIPGGGSIGVTIYVGRYPPLYYLIVGVPSLFGATKATIYEMRLVSAALSSLFLALALSIGLVATKRRALIFGVVFAITPEVLFFSGVVNSSSLEMAAAIALWTSGAAIATAKDRPSRKLVAVAAGSGAVEVLIRGLSPLWVFITASILFALAWSTRRTSVVLDRRILRGGGAVAVAVLLALAWTVHFHALDVQDVTTAASNALGGSYLHALWARQITYLHQAIAEFGWANVAAPQLTYLLWITGTAGLIIACVVRSRWRGRAVMAACGLSAFAVPFLLVLSQSAARGGLVWQGRDGAPLVLGVPIVAGALVPTAGVSRRKLVLCLAAVMTALGVAQLAAFSSALSRFSEGASHDFDLFASARWHPPLSAVLLFFVAIALVGASVVGLARAIPPTRPPEETEG